MNKLTLLSLLICTSVSTQVLGESVIVYDESSLQDAFQQASYNPEIDEIVFKKYSHISLSAPAIYRGEQSITLVGKGSTIDGSNAGSFVLDSNLTAATEDATLIFDTAGEVKIKNLKVINSATRGIVINVPADASGDDVSVNLDRVTIFHSALYGLHVDDNADAFDDGRSGSALGIELKLTRCTFEYNGTGAIDFDGVRVDERSHGDIYAFISNTTIDNNGGDGIELDEAGDGNVEVYMNRVSLNDNGFYNEEDLDDGFDIDEADDGNIEAILTNLVVNNNKDEGLDFDEAGDGNIEAKFKRVSAFNNNDEAIKLDEEDAGDIEAKLKRVDVDASGDDGIQFTELGEGKIETVLKSVSATNNKKYGIKIEQWLVEDEEEHAEDAGSMTLKRVDITGNGKGDEIKTNNIERN
ncbi:MAG: right-handed parallel beta-helix repeat-containing protein [Candidatus Thiodiazotropha lotti]|nr:right-handed parallel beta-helix repeat-containing protein [Candidatus Thiodiazotropha lotti]MCW4218677.1 right-handed parallel beta-helix repeat-containing protein [Candidatus Thiodiazotropha lotti]